MAKMETMMVEIVKIDVETGKAVTFNFPIPRIDKEKAPELIEDEEKGQFAPFLAAGIATINDLRGICNVGDFLIVDDKVYRRIRGGWREATEDDMAELLAARMVGFGG